MYPPASVPQCHTRGGAQQPCTNDENCRRCARCHEVTSLRKVDAKRLGAAQVDVLHLGPGDVRLKMRHDAHHPRQPRANRQLLGAQQRHVADVQRAGGSGREL